MSLKHTSVKCSAQRKHGRGPCGRWAIPGGTVCKMHGGSAPQVQRKAQERLKALVPNAVDALEQIVKDKKHPQRLAAAREILGRDGRIGETGLDNEGGLITLEQLEILIRSRRPATLAEGGA